MILDVVKQGEGSDTRNAVVQGEGSDTRNAVVQGDKGSDTRNAVVKVTRAVILETQLYKVKAMIAIRNVVVMLTNLSYHKFIVSQNNYSRLALPSKSSKDYVLLATIALTAFTITTRKFTQYASCIPLNFTRQ